LGWGLGWGKADYSIGTEAGKAKFSEIQPSLKTYEKTGGYAIIYLQSILTPDRPRSHHRFLPGPG